MPVCLVFLSVRLSLWRIDVFIITGLACPSLGLSLRLLVSLSRTVDSRHWALSPIKR